MNDSKILRMELGDDSYDIVIERGAIHRAKELINLNRKVMIVTDDGVPEEYADEVADMAAEGTVFTVPQGESSKELGWYRAILTQMLKCDFARRDCVVAVGGGVVGDLAGFVAASYMRGIDFYNIPTTVLSQVDSSIGGKTGVNLNGIKNIVGAFHQPKKVIIDLDLLDTLTTRQINNGLAEAVKAGLTSDPELFAIFERGDAMKNIDEIVLRSLMMKKDVVEQDEKEQGLRKILNFGHTIGHAVESYCRLNQLYHGECVALGMIPMVSEELRPRLINVLKSLNLPTSYKLNSEEVLDAMMHDKKGEGNTVVITTVDEPGHFEMKSVAYDELLPLIRMIGKEA